MVNTFFDGSVSSVVAALIEGDPLSTEEHERLSRLLDEASARTREK
jgi:predicted transcriptional regulator